MNGKVAVITGSSRGIGKGIAREFLASGAKVILNGRNEERLQATESDLKNISSQVHYFAVM